MNVIIDRIYDSLIDLGRRRIMDLTVDECREILELRFVEIRHVASVNIIVRLQAVAHEEVVYRIASDRVFSVTYRRYELAVFRVSKALLPLADKRGIADDTRHVERQRYGIKAPCRFRCFDNIAERSVTAYVICQVCEKHAFER